ncbi:tetratricopeptide repeat protein [Candidatus Woesearchaeota archaeon]|jgi:tetratricopeptide (TPR) repeat protein|nr:tetratricopeptide repeat protein [Candidatus Woesearchaeota archaeon]MBT7928718.1 tetratricopeptide repeat protein [Candidatus Peregrinibacteria bacterium]MBT3537595.1 tetratricopeptide repeat protein [Candidatus Woesearchaeota archaeon]MBT4696903.1 tetratricopeptide repeat protein [Candidatus Woesearchaeota archaeon]MBT4716423.1 tetratricopeptide repeat protein [Candidatus Woesearchaeota archaeon]
MTTDSSSGDLEGRLFRPIVGAALGGLALAVMLTISTPVHADEPRETTTTTQDHRTGDRTYTRTVRGSDGTAHTVVRDAQGRIIITKVNQSSGSEGGRTEPLMQDLYHIAETLYNAKDYISAADVFEGIVKRDPKQQRAWNRLGDSYLNHYIAHIRSRRPLLDKAIESYETALKLNPRDGDAWGGLGICYLFDNNKIEAEKAIEKGIRLRDPYAIRVRDWAIQTGKL